VSRALVAVGRNAVEATIWVDALRAAGIDARSFEQSTGAALGAADVFAARYPIFVPAGELGAARSVIAELAGGSVLAPVTDAVSAVPWRAIVLFGYVLAAIVLVVAVARLIPG